MELLKNYDVTIQYHPSKANVVENALSRKVVSMDNLSYFSVAKWLLGKEIRALESKFIYFGISKRCGVFSSIEAKSMFMEEIKAKQFKDGNLGELRTKIAMGKSQDTTLDADGVLNHKGRIYVPDMPWFHDIINTFPLILVCP